MSEAGSREPDPRPDARPVAVVTGTRADAGLLRPVMRAVRDHPALELLVIAGGTHLLPLEGAAGARGATTLDEVRDAFPIAATVPMQRAGETGREADATALGRGVTGFAEAFARLDLSARDGIAVVLGDRIEAFAAAAAASVGGIRVAHLHGGDRASGVADEALRHAITKLAHVHLPATTRSARRIIAMGEDPRRVHVVGSPAVDDLADMPALDDEAWRELGAPDVIFLLHPTGGDDETEHARAALLLARCRAVGRVLALHPNHDPGRDGILRAVRSSSGEGVVVRPHLERRRFIGALRRARMLVGNSSAGLIDGAVLAVPTVDVGDRQGGRERPAHVVACPVWSGATIDRALERAAAGPVAVRHPYGDGHAGERTAAVLATLDPERHGLRKRNVH